MDGAIEMLFGDMTPFIGIAMMAVAIFLVIATWPKGK